MLWFLSLAAECGLCIDRYDDDAVGVLGRNGAGRLAMTEVTLRPRVAFGAGKEPPRGEIETLHRRAHDACFIAASVLTKVRCEPAHD
jgi:organic hydroperoxide reductase OsmC/OhrA